VSCVADLWFQIFTSAISIDFIRKEGFTSGLFVELEKTPAQVPIITSYPKKTVYAIVSINKYYYYNGAYEFRYIMQWRGATYDDVTNDTSFITSGNLDIKFVLITFIGQCHRAPAARITDRSFVLTYLKNTFPDYSWMQENKEGRER